MSVAFLRKRVASRAAGVLFSRSSRSLKVVETHAQEVPEADCFRKFLLTAGSILSSIRKLRLRSANCGAILIEFAVCMPVLIILLFYINDLVRIKRYYSQTEFVAQQFVNIIQNISQKRAQSATTDEERANLLKITINDIKYAASLAYLSMYPGTTMYRIGTSGCRHELSHAPRLNIFYVKGLAGGKASCTWYIRFLGDGVYDPKKWSYSKEGISTFVSIVRPNTNVTPSSIYPTLKIGENEEKMIVETNLFNASHTMNPNNYVETDKQEALAKKAFKCRLVAPKPLAKKDVTATQGWYFTSVVIFTPKKGLFDPDNAPQE